MLACITARPLDDSVEAVEEELVEDGEVVEPDSDDDSEEEEEEEEEEEVGLYLKAIVILYASLVLLLGIKSGNIIPVLPSWLG